MSDEYQSGVVENRWFFMQMLHYVLNDRIVQAYQRCHFERSEKSVRIWQGSLYGSLTTCRDDRVV